jgi:hypothetical protein
MAAAACYLVLFISFSRGLSMKRTPFYSLFFLALAVTGTAGAYERGDSRERFIEWSELGSAPDDWKSDDYDDLYALTMDNKSAVTYSFEFRANVSALVQEGLSAAIRICRNEKNCTVVEVPKAEISNGLLKDSIQAFDLERGINEYSYTLFLWSNGELLDTDTLLYYISRH